MQVSSSSRLSSRRGDGQTLAKYQNRMRQRRIDSGLGFIDPPDRRYDSESIVDHYDDECTDRDSTSGDDGPKRRSADRATSTPILGAARL
ncbi:MAG TPA: hypothetical protein VI756_18415 [Blastocatellia bacterium]